jgi:hypothetical protein
MGHPAHLDLAGVGIEQRAVGLDQAAVGDGLLLRAAGVVSSGWSHTGDDQRVARGDLVGHRLVTGEFVGSVTAVAAVETVSAVICWTWMSWPPTFVVAPPWRFICWPGMQPVNAIASANAVDMATRFRGVRDSVWCSR